MTKFPSQVNSKDLTLRQKQNEYVASRVPRPRVTTKIDPQRLAELEQIKQLPGAHIIPLTQHLSGKKSNRSTPQLKVDKNSLSPVPN